MKLKFPWTPATVMLLLAWPAAADVIYSNALNTNIPLDFTGVTINVGSGSLNAFFGGVGVANNVDLQPFRLGTSGDDTIINFTVGTTLNGSTTTLASPGGFGGSIDHVGSTFTAGTEGYVGFKLNGANYGWMRVVFTNNTSGAVVKDWAYDNSGAAMAVGNITTTGSVVTANSSFGDFTVGSVLSDVGGAISLVKSGTGTTSLTAANTYTGATSVSAGTLEIASGGSTHASSGVSVTGTANLIVNGTVNGTVGMAAGTTLSGTGTIAGNTTIQGIHNPGNSPGIQSFGDDLTYSGGSSVVNWELTGNTTTNVANPNAVFDQMLITGELNFAAATSVNLVFNGAGSAVDWSNSLWDSSQSWLIYDVDTVNNFVNLDLNEIDWLDSTGAFFETVRAGSTFNFSTGVNGISLNYTVIPETSTSLLGAFGALALLRRRRK
jgi:autotransporter-associated beta strand protein